MKITPLKISLHTFNKSECQKLIDGFDDDNNYFSEAIEDGDKYYYRVDGNSIEIEKWEYERVIANPRLYYFSTALKLHLRIKRAKQP